MIQMPSSELTRHRAGFCYLCAGIKDNKPSSGNSYRCPFFRQRKTKMPIGSPRVISQGCSSPPGGSR